MILLRSSLLSTILIIIVLQTSPAQSATYYISPTGSDANPGTSARPWLSFAYAIDSARASCGDTLTLMNGTYGDGTSTGKINIRSLVCTAGNEFTLRAQNQRQAKIADNGTGVAVYIQDSAYLIIDGLYARSIDNPDSTNSGNGTPFRTRGNNNLTFRNNLARNPNRYANSHTFTVLQSQKVLLEDNESYVFHRHCVSAGESSEVVVRRQYCNPRGGRIPGGFGTFGGASPQGPPGTAGMVVSMYPCRDCIQENTIADSTTTGMDLNEMNATYASNVLMSGSKVLGSICYKCNFGNTIYINARSVADLNHSPQNIMVRDVAIIDFDSISAGIRVSDGVNIVLDHVTVMGGGSGVTGILADDTSKGSTPATNSIIMTNVLSTGLQGAGFRVVGYDTWTGDKLFSNGNRIAFDPPLASQWTNTSTKAHGMGACKVWVPVGATVKGAGTGGSDIGANILYRYVNGTLTTTPLWDPVTAEFPHGATDLDGTNAVAGHSLFDIHIRLNVNRGECPFPSNYGKGNSDTNSPVAPAGLRTS